MTLHEQLQKARKEILCNRLTLDSGVYFDERNYTEGMETAFATYQDMVDFVKRMPEFLKKLGIL